MRSCCYEHRSAHWREDAGETPAVRRSRNLARVVFAVVKQALERAAFQDGDQTPSQGAHLDRQAAHRPSWNALAI